MNHVSTCNSNSLITKKMLKLMMAPRNFKSKVVWCSNIQWSRMGDILCLYVA